MKKWMKNCDRCGKEIATKWQVARDKRIPQLVIRLKFIKNLKKKKIDVEGFQYQVVAKRERKQKKC